MTDEIIFDGKADVVAHGAVRAVGVIGDYIARLANRTRCTITVELTLRKVRDLRGRNNANDRAGAQADRIAFTLGRKHEDAFCQNGLACVDLLLRRKVRPSLIKDYF